MYPTKVRGQKLDGNEIENLQSWVWPETDTGVWDGPMGDWLNSHQHKWYKWITNWNVAIQAGGAAGMYPRMLAQKFKFVYTFEPTPTSFHCLVNNCQVDNVIKIQAALGEKGNFIDIQPGDPSNVGTNKTQDAKQQYIPMLTIDMFNFFDCGLIALDVESFERPILLGALETIKKFKPVIVGEGCDNEGIKSLLVPLGYERVDSSVSDTIFRCP